MIRIKTKYDNETDDMVFDYYTKGSHTLEHAIVIAKLWNLISKNQPGIKDEEIYILVKDILKQEREEDKNGE